MWEINCKGKKVASYYIATFKTGFLISTQHRQCHILQELPLDVFSLNKQEPVVEWHTSRSGGIHSQYGIQHRPLPILGYMGVRKKKKKKID